MKRFLSIGISVFLVLFFCSCEQPDFARWRSLPIKIKVQSFGQQEVVEFYNQYFKANIFLISKDPDAIDIFERDYKFFEKFEKGTTGWTEWNLDSDQFIDWGRVSVMNGWYNYVDNTMTNCGRNILAHELMHLLGYFKHDEDPESLMFHWVDSEKTLEELFQPHLKEWIIKEYKL